MIPLTAKNNYFKTHTEKERSDLLALVSSTPVQTLMHYAMAQLADEGFPAEPLRGARAFRAALMNMAAPEVTPAEFKPVQLERVPGTPDGR